MHGQLYSWAGNVAHLEDEVVTVEDLSRIDVDRFAIPKIEHLLPLLLLEHAGFLAEGFINQQEGESATYELGYTFEQFRCFGLNAERRTFSSLDAFSNDPRLYSSKPIARDIDDRRRGFFDEEEPPFDVVQYVMAEIFKELDGRLDGVRESKKMPFLATKANGRLYQARSSLAVIDRYRDQAAGCVPLTPRCQAASNK
jgi:hypothetical protein